MWGCRDIGSGLPRCFLQVSALLRVTEESATSTSWASFVFAISWATLLRVLAHPRLSEQPECPTSDDV